MRIGRWEIRKRGRHDDVRLLLRLRDEAGRDLLVAGADDLRLMALYGGADEHWRDVLNVPLSDRPPIAQPMTLEVRLGQVGGPVV